MNVIQLFALILVNTVESVHNLRVDLPIITTTEPYVHSAKLDKDGNYNLFWKFNDTHITFEVHVKTKGRRTCNIVVIRVNCNIFYNSALT